VKRVVCIAIALTACAPSVDFDPGNDAPLRVQGAQYFHGALPGQAPDDTSSPISPRVTSIEVDNPLIYSGAAMTHVQGRVEDSAVAIALALPTLAPVYWVFPASGGTPEFPGELTWNARVDYDRTIAPGFHPLRAVGIDANGHAGRQFELPICFLPTYPDNLSACDPMRVPPAMVITLDWDADADVDLELVTADGRRVDPKHPLVTAPMMGMVDPMSARIDRDSLRACAPDGMRQEDVAFTTRPTGHWQIFARLFDGCGIASVRFRIRVLEPQGNPPALVVTHEQGGEFLSVYDADGGVGPGLLLMSLDL
jgi:hypothetical protein